MRIWFDTEFIEDGKTIDLISIAMVREDGAEMYLENGECNFDLASDWVKENVFPSLRGKFAQESRLSIANCIREFTSAEKPEFWAYFADYDWVVLCQLYGRMIDLPDGWPMYCRDVKQELDRLGLKKPEHLKNEVAHNALHDARWTRQLHLWVEAELRDNIDRLGR